MKKIISLLAVFTAILFSLIIIPANTVFAEQNSEEMLWSNMNNKGYCVGIAYSSNGKTDGRWLQQPTELYRASETQPDGGHGMLFTAPDGTLTLSIHSPNQDAEENPTTALLIPVDDIGCTLVTQGKNNVIVRLFYRLYYAVAKLFARSGSAA